MEWIIALSSILAFLIFYYVIVGVQKSKSPPGPFPLPFIGNLLYIAKQDPVNYIALHKISQRYGDITSLKIGSMKQILVSKCEVVKDLYSRPDCLNRPVNGPLLDRMLQQNIGMAFSNGDAWQDIRKFTSKAMRDYGFGNRAVMEKLIRTELEHLVEHIEHTSSQSTDSSLYFDKFFQISFLNLMSSMLTGTRHSYNDEEFLALVKASNDYFDAPLLGILTVMAFPWTRFICPKLLGYEQQQQALKTIQNYARKILEKHRRTKNYLDNPVCFTDSFLKTAHEQRNDPSSVYTDDQFAVLCTDLIQAGTDTTANWASFAILYITLNPQVQEQVFQEILKVIGLERSPELKDKESMHYTQAVMLEIHRFARLTVTMPPRFTTTDFHYKDYLIKKDTIILVNLHSCYMDENEWDLPNEFRPGRFLNEDGLLVNYEKLSIVFGAGRRVCFGEQLGRDSSFLYLATLLQKFSFNVSQNHPHPAIDPMPGIILHPKPFHVQIRKRRN